MADEFPDPNSGGLASALPRWAWTAIIGLSVLASVSLLIPETVATSRGVPFEVFFWTVVAIQGVAALGIIAVFLYARPTRDTD